MFSNAISDRYPGCSSDPNPKNARVAQNFTQRPDIYPYHKHRNNSQRFEKGHVVFSLKGSRAQLSIPSAGTDPTIGAGPALGRFATTGPSRNLNQGRAAATFIWALLKRASPGGMHTRM